MDISAIDKRLLKGLKLSGLVLTISVFLFTAYIITKTKAFICVCLMR